jgi:hypothetical protein
MPNRLRLAALALVLAGAAAAQEIGSWVLTCPNGANTEPCQLRHQSWVLPPGAGRPGAALEVLRRDEQFVPVIAIRGLSIQAALGGVLALKATVGLRFDNARPIGLACGLDGAAVVCAPGPTETASAASQLAAAHSVVIQVQLSLPGMVTMPEQSRVLDLLGTAEALARFRATSPNGETLPVVAGLDWRGLLDHVLRDAGFEHGTADLAPSISGWFGDRRP